MGGGLTGTAQRQILRPTSLLILFLCTIALLTVLGNQSVERQQDKKPQIVTNDSNATTTPDLPPLFHAVKSQQLETVHSLLSDASNSGTSSQIVNAEDTKGLTPLIEAVLSGNFKIVKLLLDAGAPAQPVPGFRHTPLRAACLTGNVPLIELLLEKGADPNAKSEGGRTPLMGACFLRPGYSEEQSLPAVEAMLRDERTDVSIANSFGETALDLCRERKYTKSIKVLEGRLTANNDR